MDRSKRCREEPCSICGHYHDYEGGQPCGICGHVMTAVEQKQQKTVIPTAIIPGFLYLGSYDTASRSELLKAMGITHILNTVASSNPLFRNTFQYHTVSASPPPLEECFEFLDSLGQQQDAKVLVYCMSGLSRSPSVVIAYLMKVRGWRLAESYKWVKDKRPFINLHQDDQKRLMDYELQLHGSCSVPQGIAALNDGCSATFFAATGPYSCPSTSSQPQGAPSFGGGPQWSMSREAAQFNIGAASVPAQPDSSTSGFVFGNVPGSTGPGQGQSADGAMEM